MSSRTTNACAICGSVTYPHLCHGVPWTTGGKVAGTINVTVNHPPLPLNLHERVVEMHRQYPDLKHPFWADLIDDLDAALTTMTKERESFRAIGQSWHSDQCFVRVVE